MREHSPTTPDTLSSEPLNSVELGSLAVATVELSNTPEVDVEQRESERKKNTIENLRALQKRFGERFVKGNLMEGGGYAGGAARELLAGFMDQPGFSNVLKRLIPNRHGALQLLEDNHAYLQATLEKFYKEGATYERAPVKDPYELAHSVGYELTGPFASTGEFVPYDKQDFRSNEHLCTFNNPTGRLENYHILWLRHAEVDDTLPADQLTPDNLSEIWKTYLRTIGRYDQDADSYDLTGLRPSRDDPYGTSSMSVQISRKGTHVSVKNRYNHTVGNPDNTLDSDLDNVAYGLKRAVYSRVGREDLMDKTSVVLAEKYIADNEGGIHSYNYEENNIYYGDYEYIENGALTVIDRGKYVMISPQLYVPRSGKGEELNLRPGNLGGTEIAVSEDIRFLYRSSKIKAEKETEEDSPAAALRKLRHEYAERDHAELTKALHEALIAQARAAYDVYRDATIKLTRRGFFGRSSGEVMTEASFVGLLERKEAEWRENGVINHLVGELIEKGSRPNLVATPNVLADWKQIRALGVDFGNDQPYETYTNDSFLSQYSAEELSGPLGDDPVRLSIVPSAYTLEHGDVETQRQQLHALQTERPNLGFRVPSMLDAVVYWHTLRARGATMDFDTTYIRHFDAPPRRVGGWSYVPYSDVGDDGVARLVGRGAGYRRDGRLAVG